jgi:hypothetical protein
MTAHPDEARHWQPYRPDGAETCPTCYTYPEVHALEREAEAEYARTMDPVLSDVRPSRELRGRLANLRLAIQRRQACSEGHGDA